MDIVEQYAKLRAAIVELEHQAEALRQKLLRPGARLCGNRHEVIVRLQTERVLKTELLPPEILNDPRFWMVASHEQVDVRPLGDSRIFLRSVPPGQVDLLRYRC
jgi:hypothetical protein